MKHNGRIAYQTILAAKQGDLDSIQEIFHHYEPYVLHFCSRTVYDKNNIPHTIIDEEFRERIEAKYLEAILLHYDANRLPAGEILEKPCV